MDDNMQIFFFLTSLRLLPYVRTVNLEFPVLMKGEERFIALWWSQETISRVAVVSL
jgi:hypothetical protein